MKQLDKKGKQRYDCYSPIKVEIQAEQVILP